MSDWYYEQGAPDPYEEEEQDICTECEYRDCQCDAAHDWMKGK